MHIHRLQGTMPTRKAGVDERGMMRQSSGEDSVLEARAKDTEEGLAFDSCRNISFSDPRRKMKIMLEDFDYYLLIYSYF